MAADCHFENFNSAHTVTPVILNTIGSRYCCHYYYFLLRLKPCPHWRLGYSRRFRRQFVAEFGDYSRQCGQAIRLLSSSCSNVASGAELSPSGTIAGSLSHVTPVHTHLFQIFFQCIFPCPLRSSKSSSAIFWSPFQRQTNYLVYCKNK